MAHWHQLLFTQQSACLFFEICSEGSEPQVVPKMTIAEILSCEYGLSPWASSHRDYVGDKGITTARMMVQQAPGINVLMKVVQQTPGTSVVLMKIKQQTSGTSAVLVKAVQQAPGTSAVLMKVVQQLPLPCSRTTLSACSLVRCCRCGAWWVN